MNTTFSFGIAIASAALLLGLASQASRAMMRRHIKRRPPVCGAISEQPADGPTSSKGIYVAIDPATGALTTPELAVASTAASFVALHPSGKYLYATRETSTGLGAIAYSIDRATGKLTKINEQPSGGLGNCFVDVDATGKTLLVANYGSGSLASLPIAEDGSLKPPASIIRTRWRTGPQAADRAARAFVLCRSIQPLGNRLRPRDRSGPGL